MIDKNSAFDRAQILADDTGRTHYVAYGHPRYLGEDDIRWGGWHVCEDEEEARDEFEDYWEVEPTSSLTTSTDGIIILQ